MTIKTSLSEYLIPSAIGLGSGLRAGAHLLAGMSADSAADYNIEQIRYELGQFKLSTDLTEKQFMRQASKLVGQQRTAIATSGFAFSGSMVDIMVDTQGQIELERIERRRSAESKIRALEAKQQLTRKKADDARLGQFLKAGSEAAAGFYNLWERL